MEKDKVCVYSGNLEHQIELIKQYLADNGIQAFSINKKDSSVLIGDIEIYVAKDEAIKARRLIDTLNI